MSIAEFLGLLEGTREQFEWELEIDTTGQPERRNAPRLCLRGTLRDSEPALTLDPLSAVCYARTGKIVDATLADVADALEMTDATVSMVFAASNDRTWSGKGDERVPVDSLQSIRDRLFVAVGIPEARSAARQWTEPDLVIP